MTKYSCSLLVLLLALRVRAADPPPIPVGLDAYRQWDQWPLQRIGQRTYMRSTYDRRGGNEGADASHFLYQLADDQNVTLDLEGPGVLAFARYNHWHGSPWHYTVDGVDSIVQETSSKDPTKPIPDSKFEPADAFPSPLTFTWSQTKGADLTWVPIEFEKSFRMAYSRTHYGTGYYIFNRYVPGTPLSHLPQTWKPTDTPPKDVLDLINSGPVLKLRNPSKSYGDLRLKPGQKGLVSKFQSTTSVIRKLAFTLPRDAADSRLRLIVTFDDRSLPSIDAPLALFYGAGTLYNRDNREFLVKSFPMTVRYDAQTIQLACFFPMPFFKSAKVELLNEGERKVDDIKPEMIVEDLHDDPAHIAYFHATYLDHKQPLRGHDLELLDTKYQEQSEEWSGSFVGTSIIFSHEAVLNTLEGDPRFYFDDSQSPQAQGTGTEEWGGGGDYWGGRNMTLPFAGHPCGAPSAKEAKCDADKIESAYRFLLADLFPFGKNARICLEHGGTNESKEHYETVTYWYGLPAPSLVKTDTLQIGDDASEKSHEYASPDASKPYQITSRYEWGVDHLKDFEVFPESTHTGRTTTGVSEFRVQLNPQNLGVLLRRKLDYQFPNQRTQVFIADAKGDPIWRPAGIWYLAGSNTCVYSNPKEELGATQHNVQTSNRRFRDDEFLVDRNLTRGKEAIRVQIRFTPIMVPLFPGQPLAPLAWSEIRYDAYCFKLPYFKP